MKTSMHLRVALLVMAVMSTAHAKLPAPSDEAKAAATAAAAKAAWSNKVAAHQLCQSQDKVASRYLAQARAAGKSVAEPMATPPCADRMVDRCSNVEEGWPSTATSSAAVPL